MLTSSLEIMNSALLKNGEPEIASTADTSVAGEAVIDNYDRCRKIVLSRYRWNFATSRCQSEGSDNDMPGSGFLLVHDLPDECLKLIQCYNNGCVLAEKDRSLEGRCIYTDIQTLDIKFIEDIDDVDLFPDLFCEALGYYLAAEVNMLISNSKTTKDNLLQSYAQQISEAKFQNLIENPNVDRPDPYDGWENARF